MNKVFSENAWRDFMEWVREDRKTARKIHELLTDIERNGHEGIGKPEPLRHALAGTLLVSGHLQLALVAAEHPLEELEPQEGHAQRCQNPPPAPVRDRIDLQPLQQHQQRATPDHPHRRHPIASNDRFRCARPCRVGPEARAAEIRRPRTGPGGGQHRQPAMREQSPQAGRLPTAARTVSEPSRRGGVAERRAWVERMGGRGRSVPPAGRLAHKVSCDDGLPP